MADDSELSGDFWLLDSGASRHFTVDIGDFASYNALKRAHYAKTANGVALIAGIGTVLLRCLDHNSGDEKVITLTQVLCHDRDIRSPCTLLSDRVHVFAICL